jgi:hypothetical protein
MESPRIVTQTDVWLKSKEAAHILQVAESTVSNYRKHLRTCGLRDLPKNGIYQSQLWIFMKLKEAIEIHGLSKAKVKIRELIKKQQEVTEAKEVNQDG